MTSSPSSVTLSPASSEQSSEDNRPQTMLSYLHHMSGQVGKSLLKAHDRETPHIALDHCYSKPWNAHPYATRNRPARALFFTYPQRPQPVQDNISHEETIDVENAASCGLPPYDMIKARALMTEWERHVVLSHVDEGQDDWEESISRVGWTVAQSRLFNKVTKVLHMDHLARLTYEGVSNEPVLRRILTDKGAERLRPILATVQWDPQKTQWLHLMMLENLSSPYLIAYLDILQTLKAKVPSLVDKMISVTSTNPGRGAMTGQDTTIMLNKRPWDPVLPSLPHNKLKKLPGCPLLLIVPFGPSQSSAYHARRMRFWHSQLANLGKVVPVTMHTSGGGRSSIVSQCLEHMIGATRTKIMELKNHFPNRPIVMIGWSVASLIACQVALVEKVAAVVCIGFPFTGIKGRRGEVDDPLLESRTPTLFMVGQNSALCGIDDVEDLREKMKTDTSLVVVGGADEWLRISHAKKKEEGINQTIVDRCLLDEISDFLGGILTNLPLHAPEMAYGNRRSYPGPSPFFKDTKRRKRKQDGLGDEDKILLPLTTSKYKVASAIKKEFRLMGNTQSATLIKPAAGSQSAVIFDGGHQTLSQLLDAGIPPITGVRRNYSMNRQLGPIKKLKLLPGSIESTSSDSSSNSAAGGVPTTTWTDVDEAAQPSNQTKLMSVPASSKAQPAGGLTFNIGTLSSISHVQKQNMQTTKRSGQPLQSLVSKTASKAGAYANTEFNLPVASSTPSLIQFSKASSVSTPKTTGTPISIHTLPVRSAFSVPRSGVRPTIGISSLMTYSLGARSVTVSNPTSLLLSSPVTTAGGSAGSISSANVGANFGQFSNLESVRMGSSLIVHKPVAEPNLEQVQIVQKLQFHDFPLTTASLPKQPAAAGPIITQAKILSGCNLDLRRLKSLSFGRGSGVPSASLLITTSKTGSHSERDATFRCVGGASSDADLPMPEVSNSAPAPIEVDRPANPMVNYTLSSVKLHLPERLAAGPSLKIPQVSVFMLTPDKQVRRDETIIIDDSALRNTETRPEPSYFLLSPPSPIQQLPSTTVIQTECNRPEQGSAVTPDRSLEAEALLNLANSGNLVRETGDVDRSAAQFQDSVPPEEPAANLTQNAELNPNLVNETEKDTVSVLESLEPTASTTAATVASVDLQQVSSNTKKEQVATSPASRSSRFKPPPFPTIAATRTRRIRVPKYMYYDL